jgi:hypothetical protein
MRNFYVALIEIETDGITETHGSRFVGAMNRLKHTAEGIGNVTYYQVKDERQYRKAEKEFKAQVRG